MISAIYWRGTFDLANDSRIEAREAQVTKPQERKRTMAVKVAINGFGRIGRLVLRAIVESGRDEWCRSRSTTSAASRRTRICSPTTACTAASRARSRCPATPSPSATTAGSTGRSRLPPSGIRPRCRTRASMWRWNAPGIFTSKAKASALLTAGARKVLISAPGEEVDATIVYGVNHKTLTKDMTVVSNASCTTNCLAPMAKVLHEQFGILRGYMVTIHAYTGDQNTVDTLHKDLRRARAAAVSIIPTSTGAAKAVGLVLPELKGKLDGTAIRVPTPNVSLVSLDVNLSKTKATKDEINAAMLDASKGELAGILDYNTAPLVSIDFNHNPASSHVRCDADGGGGRRAGPGAWAGTTTSGASPTGCPTRPRCSAGSRLRFVTGAFAPGHPTPCVHPASATVVSANKYRWSVTMSLRTR